MYFRDREKSIKETRVTVRLSKGDVETLERAARIEGSWGWPRVARRWNDEVILSRFLRIAALRAATDELKKSQTPPIGESPTTACSEKSDNSPAKRQTSSSSRKSDKAAAAGKSDNPYTPRGRR